MIVTPLQGRSQGTAGLLVAAMVRVTQASSKSGKKWASTYFMLSENVLYFFPDDRLPAGSGGSGYQKKV